MGSHISAPVKLRSERATRGIVALFLIAGVLAAITITGSGIASATALSGGFAPKVYGGLIDVNGDGLVTVADNSDILFPSTKVIGGKIDCDAWTGSGAAETDANTFAAGSGDIVGGLDDCVLRANNGGTGHYYIWVVDGVITQYTTGTFDSVTRYDVPWGWQLPYLYKTSAAMDSNSLSTGVQAAFYAVSGKLAGIHTPFASVDSGDCTTGAGYVNAGRFSDGSNKLTVLGYGCGDSSDYNGMIDLNGSGTSNANDTCLNGCFWGYNVSGGLIQTERPGDSTTGATGATGAAGKDGVSGRVSLATTSNLNSSNKSKSTICTDTTKVLGGGYSLTGDTATLAHLTVVANGPVSGGWRVRVIEATPTAGTWSVTVNVICATA